MVESKTLTTLGVLSIPHILYCFIWFYPKAFIRACKAVTRIEAVTIFAEIAAALKRARSSRTSLTLQLIPFSEHPPAPLLPQSSNSRRSTSGTHHSGR